MITITYEISSGMITYMLGCVDLIGPFFRTQCDLVVTEPALLLRWFIGFTGYAECSERRSLASLYNLD